VREAAVVGVDDPVLGSAIKAFISAEAGALTAQDVLRHCARNLEDFMTPKYVEFRDALPKSDNGKIDRRALSAPVLEAAE
jgi:acyl-coenzyme A synthetase/AMP-(fatty) acid ligase